MLLRLAVIVRGGSRFAPISNVRNYYIYINIVDVEAGLSGSPVA